MAKIGFYSIPPFAVRWGYMAAAAIYTAAAFPDLGGLFADSDGGYQLLGAVHILANEPPVTGFRTNYGPLVFYLSAVAQLWSNHRVMGELVLVVLGFAAGYGLYLRLASRLVLHWGFLMLPALVAVGLMPRIYKYYLVLMPFCCLAAMFKYMDHPRPRNLALLGIVVTVTGLFRPDFGVYALIAASVAVWLPRRSWRDLAWLLLGTFLAASPWLVYIGAQGGLLRYLADSSLGAFATAQGLALPLPTTQWSATLISLANVRNVLFLAYLALPTWAGVMLLLGRSVIPQMQRLQLVVTIVFAQLCMIQSLHRSDWGHLLQAIPVSLVLAAWLCSHGLTYSPRFGVARISAVLASGVLLLSALQIGWAGTTPSFSPSLLGRKIRTFMEPIARLGPTLSDRDPGNEGARLVAWIRTHTGPRDRILVLPASPQFAYLSERLIIGGQLALLPGHFDGYDDQSRLIAALRRTDAALIIVRREFSFDDRPGRRLEAFAPQLMTYLQHAYVRVYQTESFDLLAPLGADLGSE